MADVFDNFVIIIGAMKAGTSSLHHYIGLHPDITMSDPKELDFFVDRKTWSKGIDWYRGHFTSSARWHGESSTSYTKHPIFDGVPERIREHIPNARFVYVLRDPIDRIVSHYVHNRWHGRETREFAEAVRRDPIYLQTSLYMHQLGQFEAFFPRERFVILTQEGLRNDRAASIRRVFEHLDVDPDFSDPRFFEERHDSASKREPTTLTRKLGPLGKVARAALPAVFERPLERPDIDETTQDWLLSRLRPEVEALRTHTGLPFSDWSI